MVASEEQKGPDDGAPRAIAPAEDLTLDDSRRPGDRRALWRGVLLSFTLHAAIVIALIGLWQWAPPPETVLRVALVTEGPGAAGATGGANGEAKAAGHAAAEGDSQTAAPASSSGAPSAATEPSTPAPPETAPPPPQAAEPIAAPPPLAPDPAPPKPLPPRPRHKPRAPAPPTARPDIAPPPPQAAQARTQAVPPMPAAAPQETASSATSDKAAAAPAAAGIGTGPAGPGGVGQGAEGQGHGVVGNGPQDGPGDDYLDRLRRWLARYKKYPEEALKRKVEGEVVVAFTLARDGTVLSAQVEKSSGSLILDDAAVQMLHDASPVPPVPERYKGRELHLTIPVDYSIGFFERLFR